MAEGQTHPGGQITADPATLRREMTQTRAALTDDLGQLKSRLLGIPGTPPKGRKTTMATKKAAPKSSSSAKKKDGDSKHGHARSAHKSTSKSATKSATKGATKIASKVVKKTKEVLGEMLAGAAEGAVKGAAQAVLPHEDGQSQEGRSEHDGHSGRGRKKSEK